MWMQGGLDESDESEEVFDVVFPLGDEASRWPTQAFLWLVWGSSTAGQSLPSHCGTRPQKFQN